MLRDTFSQPSPAHSKQQGVSQAAFSDSLSLSHTNRCFLTWRVVTLHKAQVTHGVRLVRLRRSFEGQEGRLRGAFGQVLTQPMVASWGRFVTHQNLWGVLYEGMRE